MQVVRRILDGEKVPALSKELGIHRKLLYEWIRRVREGGESNLRERGRPRKAGDAPGGSGGAPERTGELERMIAHQQLVIDFLGQALQRCQSAKDQAGWRDAIFETIAAMAKQRTGLNVKIMCDLARVPRCGYYRYLRTRAPGASGL